MKKIIRLSKRLVPFLMVEILLLLLLTQCGVYNGYAVSARVVPYTFVSVSNFGNTTFLSYYLKSDGSLVQSSNILATGTMSSSPNSFALAPAKNFLFVAMFNSNNIAVYGIAPMSDPYPSVLTPISPKSVFDSGKGTTSVAMSPSGNYLYSTSYSLSTNNVSVYSVASSGALTLSGSDTASVNPSWVAVHPSGNYAYVTNQGSSNVSAFSVSSTATTLSAISGALYDTDATPVHAIVDPSGKTLLVANTDGGTVTSYTIGAAGTLTAAASTTTGYGPVQIAIHPTLNFVYVANTNSDNITGYTLAPTTGALTALAGSPFTLSGQTAPYALAIDPTGMFLIATWTGAGTLTVFNIDQNTGAISSVGSPKVIGINPKAVSVYQLNQNE